MGGGGGGGGSRGSGSHLSYMMNYVMHTIIYAAFCMLPSLDLQACKSFQPSGVFIDQIKSSYITACVPVSEDRVTPRIQ